MAELWGRIRAFWDNLSQSERRLLSALGVTFAAAILYLIVIVPIENAMSNAHNRVEVAEDQLQSMLRLRRQFEQVNGRLAVIERRIQTNRERRDIFTLLESLASRAQVKVDSMEQRTAPEGDRYRETRVEVALRGVTLQQAVNYLKSIELENRVLSVKSLRMRTRADKPELLDVTFSVSSFEVIGAG
ncbi:MAG: type II secretion system protein M [Proteobacteria bacterium]|nr:type II secretion system protein M [Pseudomonadota bacterium]